VKLMTSDTASRIMRLIADPATRDDPYPLYHELRAEGPVLWVAGPPDGPRWLNRWHVFDYENVSSVLRDTRFSSRMPMATPPHTAPEPEDLTPEQRKAREYFWRTMAQPTMITSDAPDHTRLRRLVAAAFTPRVVASMEDTIGRIVNDLLDEAAAKGDGFDVVRDLSYPLPTIVIAALLGVPFDDWQRVKRLSDGLITFFPRQETFDQLYALDQYWAALIAKRRAEPADDLVSALIAARDEGDVLSDEELIGQCTLLLVAGHETTTYALGSAVLHLLRHPAAWESLSETPIGPAVEELLRYDAPFQALNRRAAVNVELGGQRIRASDQVQVWIGAANRDPARFADPDALDLARDDNRHLSFGLGAHYCLGAALARLELQTALRGLRERFPGLRRTEEPVVRRTDSAIRGPAALPVRHA
jgi:cytochrome P450